MQILKTIRNANKFLSGLYRAGVWLDGRERDILISFGRAFLDGFKACAEHAFLRLNLTRWKYQPKYHLFAEVVFKMELNRRDKVPSINPVVEGTQIDEDFVGVVSRWSTQVSIRKVGERTLKKYLVGLAAHW